MSEYELKRDAFLYLEPTKDKAKFAQCATCMMFTGDANKTCTIHGGDQEISSQGSCGLYVPGDNHTDMAGKEVKAVSAQQSGYVEREVRCENCSHYEPEESCCELYEYLNGLEAFNLDQSVQSKGCCNAQTPLSGMNRLRKKSQEDM